MKIKQYQAHINNHEDGLVWEYTAETGGKLAYLITAVKPTKKQMRQVRKALRKATK